MKGNETDKPLRYGCKVYEINMYSCIRLTRMYVSLCTDTLNEYWQATGMLVVCINSIMLLFEQYRKNRRIDALSGMNSHECAVAADWTGKIVFRHFSLLISMLSN